MALLMKAKSLHTWGSVVHTTGSTDQDVEATLGIATPTFQAKDKLQKSKLIGRATKVNVFNS